MWPAVQGVFFPQLRYAKHFAPEVGPRLGPLLRLAPDGSRLSVPPAGLGPRGLPVREGGGPLPVDSAPDLHGPLRVHGGNGRFPPAGAPLELAAGPRGGPGPRGPAAGGPGAQAGSLHARGDLAGLGAARGGRGRGGVPPHVRPELGVPTARRPARYGPGADRSARHGRGFPDAPDQDDGPG